MSTFEQLKARFAMTSEHRELLMQATAEALALPQMVCRHRVCRRERRCGYLLAESSEPHCVAGLKEDPRAGFDAVFALVERIYEGWSHMTPSSDLDRRDDERLAIRASSGRRST
jgi:hypothetical protein